MARGRLWTAKEDQAIRFAAAANRLPGGYTAVVESGDVRRVDGERQYAARLRAVAAAIGRTYQAVVKRASRIGAPSKQPHHGGGAGAPVRAAAPPPPPPPKRKRRPPPRAESVQPAPPAARLRKRQPPARAAERERMVADIAARPGPPAPAERAFPAPPPPPNAAEVRARMRRFWENKRREQAKRRAALESVDTARPQGMASKGRERPHKARSAPAPAVAPSAAAPPPPDASPGEARRIMGEIRRATS